MRKKRNCDPNERPRFQLRSGPKVPQSPKPRKIHSATGYEVHSLSVRASARARNLKMKRGKNECLGKDIGDINKHHIIQIIAISGEPEKFKQRSEVEKLTRPSLKGLLNRAPFAYKNGHVASSLVLFDIGLL